MSGEIRDAIEEITIESECTNNNDGHFQSMKKIFTCELCNVQVTSNNVLRRHKEGRKHILRVERQGKTFQCDLCNIVANSQSQLDAHLKSSKHNARLIKKENANQMMKKGVWIIIFGIICIFVNLLLLFKYINNVV
ncbi:hypothetical protein QE152_g32073 [Popillia japonica]|uniref:C2H2-type domain-containing protein n=1 Tax=Popillia japonica TaxID=7064 RepID=A0AAW1IZW6_POPJA